MAQYIIVGIIIAIAVLYLTITIVRKARKGGCDCTSQNCDCQKCDGCSLRQNCKLKTGKHE